MFEIAEVLIATNILIISYKKCSSNQVNTKLDIKTMCIK